MERPGLDADIWHDASSACIFFKLSLLPAALSPDTQGVADLKSLLQSASHARVLLVLEQYSSTGNAVQLTPPLQFALAKLPKWISSQVDSTSKSVEHVVVTSPAKAAMRCREWGSRLEAEAALAPGNQVDQQVTTAATWRARETWLTDEPYADEACFEPTCAGAFAAALIVAVRGSAKTFAHDSLEYKLWQFGNVLSDQGELEQQALLTSLAHILLYPVLRQLHAQLRDSEEDEDS